MINRLCNSNLSYYTQYKPKTFLSSRRSKVWVSRVDIGYDNDINIDILTYKNLHIFQCFVPSITCQYSFYITASIYRSRVIRPLLWWRSSPKLSNYQTRSGNIVVIYLGDIIAFTMEQATRCMIQNVHFVIHIRHAISLGSFYLMIQILSTFVISKSKGLSEILRVIRTSTYQICRIEEKINRTSTFHKSICNLTP